MYGMGAFSYNLLLLLLPRSFFIFWGQSYGVEGRCDWGLDMKSLICTQMFLILNYGLVGFTRLYLHHIFCFVVFIYVLDFIMRPNFKVLLNFATRRKLMKWPNFNSFLCVMYKGLHSQFSGQHFQCWIIELLRLRDLGGDDEGSSSYHKNIRSVFCFKKNTNQVSLMTCKR